MQNFSLKTGENTEMSPAAAVLDFVKFDMNITDKNLYKLCKRYGANALLWRRRFAGLLPEVERRRLYEKKGFISIFVFAAKLAGMRKEHVRRVLNVAKKFEIMPILKGMLENGEVSVNKLARVASVATPENQEFWAVQARLLSKSALETLVRDEKYLKNQLEHGLRNSDGQIFKNGKEKSEKELGRSGHISENGQENSVVFQNQNGLFKPENSLESVPGHTLNSILPAVPNFGGEQSAPSGQDEFLKNGGAKFSPTDSMQNMQRQELNLSPAVKQKLLNLQRKGIDINELLTEFLEKRDEEIAETKERLAAAAKSTDSRHIAAEIDKLIAKEFGTKCSIDWCMREAVEIHHLQRFSLSQKHDPRYLAPLCEEHHAIAHSIDVKFHEVRAQSLYPEQKPAH